METKIKEIISQTLTYEGGYCNVKGDRGGETYCGIARNFDKTWEGWKTIDAIKKTRTIKYNEHIPSLDNSVYDYYYNKYWLGTASQIYADDADSICTAALLFDWGVNSGKGTAAKYFQEALNKTNKIFLKVDGVIGANTVYAYKHTKYKEYLNGLYLGYRRSYLRKVANNGSNSKFLKGWMTRCDKLHVKYNILEH